MKKYLFMVTVVLTSSSCVASIAELDKAIKKSDVQKVNNLSKILRLTKEELNAFISLAHNIAENRQLDIQTFKLAKHPPLKNKVSKNYIICALLGSIFTFGSFAYWVHRESNDSVARNMFITALGSFVTSIIFFNLAEKATGKYLKKRYLDAQDVQRIIQCWPLMSN